VDFARIDGDNFAAPAAFGRSAIPGATKAFVDDANSPRRAGMARVFVDETNGAEAFEVGISGTVGRVVAGRIGI
jgi:hypothetical protein